MTRLRIVLPGSPDSVLELGTEEISIGRDPVNSLHLNVPWLSRTHARIFWDGERHLLEDRGSRNGTYLNGGRLRRALPLADRDWITVGDLQIFYEKQGSALGDDAKLAELPGHSTVLIQSQDLTIDRYQEATRESVAAEGSLLPALHAAASALIHNYPLDELSALVLKLARDSVTSERAALFLRPRPGGTPAVRRPRIPRRVAGEDEEREETGQRPSTPDSVGPLDTGTLELPLLQGAKSVAGTAPGGLRLAAAHGYGDNEAVHISTTILRQVMEGQRAVLTIDAQSDERFGDAVSVQLAGIRSVICVPLWNNREVIGVLYLDHLMVGHVFSEIDLRLAGLIANMAAVKIENVYLLQEQIEKQRLEEQLSVGAKIQRRLLPAESPRLKGYDLHGHNRSCYQVGGDYFDFIKKADGKFAIVIADVAGKGVGAALLMAGLQASLRALAGTSEAPASLVRQLNRVLVESSPSNKFATLFYGELDLEAHTLEYVNGGHIPPGLLKADERIEILTPSGPSVGLFPDVNFESRTVPLPPDSTLLLCTDGVTERTNDTGEEFGQDRLMEFLAKEDFGTALDLAEGLEGQLTVFSNGRDYEDDSTVVILQRAS